ncbi:hypothetical protein [Methylobrevis pamukkalensis]|uniref:Uncharacterized protein n=1 Tax=Methylobrevis pamukkalensis TaxID=1439726 RepID=A0A1E3H079_9HYPH|nr:hypothetical protein [Methylobrevis pamukkalensis]ODN69226.1 hypothetical protein A6302_03488 [Methylobrevis pamukkalensis]
MIRLCTFRLKSTTPYSQSASHDAPKLNDKETPEDYDKRTWREKATVTDDGIVGIPGMGLKQAVDAAAGRLSIKSKGRQTLTKNFLSGAIPAALVFPIASGKKI